MTKSDPTLVFIRFLSFVFLCFFVHYLGGTVYSLYLQRLINYRIFLAPFVMVKYPAYDKSTVVDNLLITSLLCLDVVWGVGCLKAANLRRPLIQVTESRQERELVDYKLLISKNLRLMPEAACR